MIVYQVVEETLSNEDFKNYQAFGVAAYHLEESKCEPLAFVSDVFLNVKAAYQFVSLCNRLELDLIHFKDAIEDVVTRTA